MNYSVTVVFAGGMAKKIKGRQPKIEDLEDK